MGYTTTPPGSSEGNKAGGCPPFPPTVRSFPSTAPYRNWTSGSFHYLLTPCQRDVLFKLKDLWFESKTWGQTSCFTSQRCLGRHTCYTQYATPSRPGDETFALGFTAGNGNLACESPHGTLQLCTLKVHSAVLVVSQIINSTHQRFAFHAYYIEHSPNNILWLGDATVSLTYLCMREGKRSQKIKSVPWLLTWLV